MTISRRRFVAACAAVVGGMGRLPLLWAGPFGRLNGMVEGVTAGVFNSMIAGVCVMVAGAAVMVPLLLFDESITWLKENLPLSEKQKQALDNLRKEVLLELEPLIKASADGKGVDMLKEFVRLDAKYRPKLKEILDGKGWERFLQLQRQLQGPAAMLDAEAQKQLALDEDQVKQLQAIVDDLNDQLRKSLSEKNDRPLVRVAVLLAARAKAVSKAKDVLTPEQQTKWEELVGKGIDPPRMTEIVRSVMAEAAEARKAAEQKKADDEAKEKAAKEKANSKKPEPEKKK